MSLQHITDTIAEAMLESRLTPAEVAERYGSTVQAVRDWLRGKSAPRYPKKLARILGIPVDKLVR